jgi:hypothetical protein
MTLGLGLGWGCSLGLSPLGFSTSFSSLGFSLFPKEHFPQSAYEFDGLLEIICGVREYGWIWICVEFV